MAKNATGIAFYDKPETARAILQVLRTNRFYRATAILGSQDGQSLSGRFTLPRDLLGRFRRCVSPNETLLILQAPLTNMSRAVELLGGESGAQPSIFLFRPPVEAPRSHEEFSKGTPLADARLRERAEQLASLHTLSSRPAPGQPVLRRLRESEFALSQVLQALAKTAQLQRNVPISAEWLLDNAYLVQAHVQEVRHNLPKTYYRELPTLVHGEHAGLPRVYGIAADLLAHTDARLNLADINDFLSCYQNISPLTIGELWATPLMLRLRLIESLRNLALQVDVRLREGELADFWANRLLSVARRDAAQLHSFLAELAREQPSPSPHFVEQLAGHLYDEENALSPVRQWAESCLNLPLAEISQQEHRDHLAAQVSITNVISSLRRLSQFDWRDIFEAVSRVDDVLRNDPAGVYPRMDFATRDRYRHALEEMAKGSGVSELDVARQAVERAKAGTDELTRHAGYHLTDKGRESFEQALRYRPKLGKRLRRWIKRHSASVYLGSIAAMTVCVVAAVLAIAGLAGTAPTLLAILGLLALLPASEIAVQITNYLVTHLLSPRGLPRMSFKHGIPDEYRTLVVVPMMLLARDTIRGEVERLEIRYLANPDPNLRFALLSDFSDAPQQHMLEDAELIEVAAQGIEQLNTKYARHGPGRFLLFHRERVWSEAEQCWMGWERKRGKIEHLNRFLMGEPGLAGGVRLRAGEAARLHGIRFVITLDADTQLPKDTARHMVETIAHPLNRPVLSADQRRIERGYTVIQPRVSTSLPSATATRFSQIFTDPTGTDPYTLAVSDVYQDLTGEGSYHGKGIYDVRCFHAVLANRFPQARLLSHDLIEGAHVRVGLATNIELLDLFPADYVAYATRQHRWLRGDWQIADWVFSRVPTGSGGRGANPLSAMNRWKILDNLRRSLVPVASVALLVTGWLWTPVALVWSLLVLSFLFLPSLFALADHLHNEPRTGLAVRRGLWRSVLRGLASLSLLLHQAQIAVDAIARVAYRRLISQRHLLEWETAQEAHSRSKNRERQFLLTLSWIPLCTAMFSAFAVPLSLQAQAAAVGFLQMWFVSPLLIAWLNRAPRPPAPLLLGEEDRQMLRQVARRTWRYFDRFVEPKSNWLAPDNYQEALRTEIAARTSPTNIGFGLLAPLMAHDFGYITLDDVVRRSRLAMEALGKLERYQGHLLNWYNTETLEPLRPRYVSMVDSGNLLASLWTLEQGLHELVATPLIGSFLSEGLLDALAMLQQTTSPDKSFERKFQNAVSALQTLHRAPVHGLEEILRRIQLSAPLLRDMMENMQHSQTADASRVYWAQQVEEQLKAWQECSDGYLSWMGVLASPPAGGLLPLGPGAHQWRREAMTDAPSLRMLAASNVPGLSALVALQSHSQQLNLSQGLRDWLDKLSEATARAQRLAAERLHEVEQLIASIRKLAEGMDFRFLYVPERRLFAIGFNVSEQRLDTSYYDLLAGEARLGSLIAIARGDVPVEHWLALGRPFRLAYGRRVMASWSGTMFEYLMPLLLTRSIDHSLLDETCKTAVACQIDYGKQRGIPWGISEAAFSAVDARRIYQYRAFGVPGLGLRRGLEDDLVVAPYATALALAVQPAAAAQNLRRLASPSVGMLGDYGFFDSIDYTRAPGPGGQRGVIVNTYMAHHQGMVLAAIDNALHHGVIQRRFHADARVRAVESLLYERIPAAPTMAKVDLRERPLPRLVAISDEPVAGRVDTPDTALPRTHLLSNGAYTVMITNSGGGYSRWNDFDITRWRADTTRDANGTFCYVKNMKTGAIWSAPYQPICAKTDHYSANFTPEKAEFRRRDRNIDTLMEIIVPSEDNAEIRRVTLTNRSRQVRQMELTSYVELALAPHNADRTHPAFSKLFIQTEALPELRTLLAWRKPRDPSEKPVYAAHVIAMESAASDPWTFETDRSHFLGRGRTAADPIAMRGELTNRVGHVLDPIFSLRRRVVIGGGQRVEICFVTVAAATREEAIALVEKYRDVHAANRALDAAWASAQLEMRHLHIQQEQTEQFQQLASYILYPHAHLRPTEDRLRKNRLPQSRLWAHGISGDLPIVVVTIADEPDVDLIQQTLVAHRFWRARGLKVDLLILDEAAESYEKPLRERLQKMVQAQSHHIGAEVPGGIFLRSAAQIPPEELTLLFATARVVLVASRGSLRQQLGVPRHAARMPPAIARDLQISEESSAALPFLELPFFNGLGGFTPDGKEYAIYLGPGTTTPAPWINVMANPQFGALMSESGSGFCWYANSQSNRLTPWSNDPVSDPSADVIYIRDEDLGVFWTPTPLPIREQDAYRARHGQGYTVFEHNSHAIEQELLTFVPMDQNNGAPLRVQRLRLRNRSSRHRRFTVAAYCEWVLGTTREETQMHVVTSWDAETRSVFARNSYHPDFGGRVAFLSASPAASSYTADRSEFLGRNGSPANPAAMQRIRLSNRSGASLDPCAALEVSVEIAPGQQAEILFVLGQATDAAEARALVKQYCVLDKAEGAFQATRKWWDDLLGCVQVETPDLAASLLLNRWLPYQNLSCRFWGRSGFYQSGGAYGFRDQLQDVMALVYAAPRLAREHILRAAGRQFAEGDVQHWWHPPSGAGVRTTMSDDLLWLPFVTAHYVRVTGDDGILGEDVPFLSGKALQPGEHEAYYVPEISTETGTLLEHCRRALEKGLTKGPHGLPLIGTGDWNDGLNRVGVEGKGESVWLAWFLIHVLNDFAELLSLQGEAAMARDYRDRARSLASTVEAQAWDGKWYRRAYFDDGTPLGSQKSDEAQIDSLSQTWGVISGAADPARAESALQAVEKHLVREKEKMILLFEPPFEKSPMEPGYIKAYPPGVRENGGQYTHAALWVAMAFARYGKGSKAVELLRMMNPVEHARTEADVQRYKVEPYVVAADIYRLQGHIGRGGWTWYTGSAGWMYRVWLEEILGFKLRGSNLTIDPVIPMEWNGFKLQYRYGTTWYEIAVENPRHVERGIKFIELDGAMLLVPTLPLRDDGVRHAVRVVLGGKNHGPQESAGHSQPPTASGASP